MFKDKTNDFSFLKNMTSVVILNNLKSNVWWRKIYLFGNLISCVASLLVKNCKMTQLDKTFTVFFFFHLNLTGVVNIFFKSI